MTLSQMSKTLALLIGAFVFFTAAVGPYEAMVQRAIFLALVICLGFTRYPLGKGRPWRLVGLVVDWALVIISVAACFYNLLNSDESGGAKVGHGSGGIMLRRAE